MSYEPTTLTYQPVNAANLKGHDIPEMNYKSKWYSNGVAMQHIYVTVMHRPTDDGMSFHFEYEKKEVTEDELEQLYYYICRRWSSCTILSTAEAFFWRVSCSFLPRHWFFIV